MADTNDVELSEVTRNCLNQVLSKELETDKIDVDIAPGSKKGDNFIGIVYRVEGKESTNNNYNGILKNNKSISLILKVAPKIESRRDKFLSRVFFLREIYMYDDVLPMFHQFQESCGIIPEESGFHEYPKCYKTIEAELDETLIFQDLKADQFEMFDRFDVITIEHARLIMKALGKYHGLSFALRDQHPEQLEHYSKMAEVLCRTVDEGTRSYSKMLLNGACQSLNHKGDERLLEKVTELFERDHFSLMADLANGEIAEPYAVMCHGDCWNNNVLFKYDEHQKPIDLRLLDWQIARYATPVTDLVYYIFCSTTKSLRDEYYDDMINTYHDSLSEMVTKLGSDPVKLFPFDALQDQLRKFGKYGLVMASMVLPIITSPPDEILDLDELAESIQNRDTSIEYPVFTLDEAIFNERMRNVIVDMDRLGYI